MLSGNSQLTFCLAQNFFAVFGSKPLDKEVESVVKPSYTVKAPLGKGSLKLNFRHADTRQLRSEILQMKAEIRRTKLGSTIPRRSTKLGLLRVRRNQGLGKCRRNDLRDVLRCFLEDTSLGFY